jgi:CheY-like chemotaxis protein
MHRSDAHSPSAPLVLLVEDDHDLRTALAEVLDDEGYDVWQAENGREALEALRARPASVVLLDLMMPVMSGWEFLAALRRDPGFHRVRVVVVTASLDPPPGAYAYLSKPFELRELLAVIGDATGERPHHEADRGAHA